MSNGERRKEPLQHRVQPLLQLLRHPLVLYYGKSIVLQTRYEVEADGVLRDHNAFLKHAFLNHVVVTMRSWSPRVVEHHAERRPLVHRGAARVAEWRVPCARGAARGRRRGTAGATAGAAGAVRTLSPLELHTTWKEGRSCSVKTR